VFAVRRKWRWFSLAFAAGVGLCVYDQFQPFHLKSLQLEHFSAETELALREWSNSFLAFHPAWLLAKDELRELERHYPMTIASRWEPWQGVLKLTAVPFVPAMKIKWRHSDYLAAPNGTVWRADLWNRALNLDLPELPMLNVGNQFPLLVDPEAAGPLQLKVPYAWLADLLTAMNSLKDVTVSDLLLTRRGGEDVVICNLVPAHGKGRFSFTGNVAGLEKSLIVVRELLKEKANQNILIDATYEDKIIIRRESDPETESSK